MPSNSKTHLTPRELELLTLAASGCTDKEAAEELGLSVQTVRSYWRNIKRKRGGSTRSKIIADELKSAVTPDVTRWCLNSFHAKRGVDLEGLKGQGIPASILSAALLLLDVAVI